MRRSTYERGPGPEGSFISPAQDKSFHISLALLFWRIVESIHNSLRLAPIALVVREPSEAHSFTYKILLEHLLFVIHGANHTSG